MRGPDRNRRRMRRLAIGCAAGICATGGIPAELALAGPSSTVTETINVTPPATLGVALTTNAVTMCSSTSPLTFPAGMCTSPTITITNGSAPSNIEVEGTNLPMQPPRTASRTGG